MKIAIVGDTHFGSRNDHKVFHDFFGKFYSDILFPYLKEHDITKVIQLGDLFDRRKYINFYTLAESKKYFFDKLDNIEFHTLVGNHDIYWRESLEVNSSSLVLGEYNNVTVHTTPKTIICDNTSIDIIPWICDENKAQVIEFIKNSKSDICMGHFEIAGFSMYKGMEAHDGLDGNIFAKYELVLSGHYHTRSKKENIIYAGVPYEMTWSDYNDKKGFHVFDTETRKLDFIENPYSIFHRIQYDDTQKLVDLDKLDLKDCFVRLVVVNKTDYYKFDKYVNTLYNKGCYEIKIVEDLSEFTEGEVGEEINLEDTLSVLSNYIDSVETEADTEKVKTFMKSLYVEAVNLGV
jgi:DNA repair exonuclease SbcCD nuclease subunit